ncbi:hypothetical protein C5167_028091 [Papaver somniferum]|nr:hypothetical protein C5167_028091 [Papaver somniferum]
MGNVVMNILDFRFSNRFACPVPGDLPKHLCGGFFFLEIVLSLLPADVSPPHDSHVLNLKCKETQECVAPCRDQYSAPGSCFLLPPSFGGLRHCCCELILRS